MMLMNRKYTSSKLIIRALLQLLLCLISLCQLTSAANSSETYINWHGKIYKDIIDNGVYIPHVFPGRGNGTPMVVSASLSLSALQDIDEKNQLLKTVGWVNMLWRDESLQWNPEDYAGVEKIHVPNHHIWIPDLTIENSLNVKTFQYGSDNKAIIYSSGNVNFSPGQNFVTSCAIDVTYFPFDVQTCSMTIMSWVHDDSELKLTTDPWPKLVNHTGLDHHGEWIVEDTWVELETMIYYNITHKAEQNNYTVMQCNLRFRRMPLYYMVNVICPCFLITLLSVSVFCLPSGCGEKISLGITVLLSYVVFLLIVVEMMPPRSDTMPLLGVYLTIVMILTGSSILSSIMVVSMDDKASYSWPSPRIQTFTAFMARVLCVSNKLPGQSHAKLSPSQTQYNLCENTKIKSEVEKSTCPDSKLAGDNKMGEDHKHAATIQEEKELGLVNLDWKFVARVVDRFLLYLYLMIISLLCLVSIVLWLMPKANSETKQESN